MVHTNTCPFSWRCSSQALGIACFSGGRLRTDTCPALLAGMNSQLALGFPAVAPSDTVIVNTRCILRSKAERRVVVVGGLPVRHYCTGNAVAEAYAMVMFVESGFAEQTQVARAFGKFERSVRRYQERYEQAGTPRLGRPCGWRRGRRRISGKRLRVIVRLKSAGLSNRAIAQQLGVNENAWRGGSLPSHYGALLISFAATRRRTT